MLLIFRHTNKTGKKMKNEPQLIEKPESGSSLISLFANAIIQSEAPTVETMRELLAVQVEYEKNEAAKSYAMALSNFQSLVPEIEKNGLASFGHRTGGGTTEYTFAVMGDIQKAIKEPLSKSGLSYHFKQIQNGTLITVVCVIRHAAGHSEEFEMTAGLDQSGSKNGIQQAASTISYLRRYTLTGALGLASVDADNDGHDYDQGESAAQPYAAQNLYSESDFQANYQTWINNKVSAEQVIEFINGQGFLLTDGQLQKLSSLGQE